MGGLRKNATVRIGETRAKGLKSGQRGKVRGTWPKGHEYHGKYFRVQVGERVHVLARGAIKAA